MMVNSQNDNLPQSLLILARPGRKRDILQSLLKSKGGVEIIDPVDDSLSALRIIAEHHPKLFLLEVDLLNNEAWPLLKQIKTNRPQTRCLVMVDSSRQQRQALDASADRVLINGFPISELFDCVDELLSEKENII